MGVCGEGKLQGGMAAFAFPTSRARLGCPGTSEQEVSVATGARGQAPAAQEQLELESRLCHWLSGRGGQASPLQASPALMGSLTGSASSWAGMFSPLGKDEGQLKNEQESLRPSSGLPLVPRTPVSCFLGPWERLPTPLHRDRWPGRPGPECLGQEEKSSHAGSGLSYDLPWTRRG